MPAQPDLFGPAPLAITLPSVYHRLFDVVRELEGASASAFQYIVTTTTPPPPELQKSPWLRLELRGAPHDERLLRCDLP